jgi:hypothetical protein
VGTSGGRSSRLESDRFQGIAYSVDLGGAGRDDRQCCGLGSGPPAIFSATALAPPPLVTITIDPHRCRSGGRRCTINRSGSRCGPMVLPVPGGSHLGGVWRQHRAHLERHGRRRTATWTLGRAAGAVQASVKIPGRVDPVGFHGDGTAGAGGLDREGGRRAQTLAEPRHPLVWSPWSPTNTALSRRPSPGRSRAGLSRSLRSAEPPMDAAPPGLGPQQRYPGRRCAAARSVSGWPDFKLTVGPLVDALVTLDLTPTRSSASK